jgi:type II secretory ATPase GspE/PulE/Tfp pilus assembly ATPase PilB-like protein
MAKTVPVDAEDPEDFLLANNPEFVASMREAEADLATGRAVPALDVLDDSLGNQAPHRPPLSADAAVAEIVDSILAQAVLQGASHIHIEPQADRLRVRFRIGRTQREVQALPTQLAGPIASRLKVMAGLDIAGGDPQKGRTAITVDGSAVDVSVATSVTTWGEKVVLRLV